MGLADAVAILQKNADNGPQALDLTWVNLGNDGSAKLAEALKKNQT